jgi:hypothetical protein
MLRKGLLLVTALGLVIVSSPVARADMCFSYKKSGGGTLVAKGAKLPATNTCETLALFESGGQGGAATGSICMDNATFTIIFHYTYDGCTANYFESATCALQIQNGNLPTVSSSCRGTANGSPFQEVNDAVLEPCEVTAIPGGGGGRCTGGFSHRTGVSAPPGRVAR